MRKYQHKYLTNIQVEAERVGQDTYAPLAVKLGAHVIKEIDRETDEVFMGLNVLTSTGWNRASEGDWVVDSPVGFFVLGDDLFQQRYEEIVEEPDGPRDLFKERGGKVNGE